MSDTKFAILMAMLWNFVVLIAACLCAYYINPWCFLLCGLFSSVRDTNERQKI